MMRRETTTEETTLRIDLASIDSIRCALAFVCDERATGWKYNRYRVVYSIENNQVFDTGPIVKPNDLHKIVEHLSRSMNNPYDTYEQVLLRQLKYERALFFKKFQLK